MSVSVRDLSAVSCEIQLLKLLSRPFEINLL